MTIQSDTELAKELFRSFHEREPRPDEIIQLAVPTSPPVALAVGTLVSLGYKANGDGQTYYHEFEHVRPLLFVTPNGRQAYIVGGSYRFTDRGFIK